MTKKMSTLKSQVSLVPAVGVQAEVKEISTVDFQCRQRERSCKNDAISNLISEDQ